MQGGQSSVSNQESSEDQNAKSQLSEVGWMEKERVVMVSHYSKGRKEVYELRRRNRQWSFIR